MNTTECLARLGIAQGDEFAYQRELLMRLLRWAYSDERILAVHLKGSLARHEGDRYSDIDAVGCKAGRLDEYLG